MLLDDYTQGDLKKQLITMAVPVSVGFFFNTMFNVVDTFYAGQLSTEALAGMSLSFAVFFMLIAIISGVSTGLSVLLSISSGKKDVSETKILTASGMLLIMIISLIVSIAGYIVSPSLLYALGARGETLNQGAIYVQAIYAGAVFFGLNFGLNALLSSRGVTKPYRNFLIIGFFMNLVLNPLFIFGYFGLPRMGTFGVALATIVVQIFGSIYLLYQCKKILNISYESFSIKYYKLKAQFDILSQGLPASLNMLTIAFGIFVINYFIYQFGDDFAIAGYGVAMRIEQLALLPALGLNTAALTIAGQNFGANNYDRIRKTYNESIKIGVLIMTIGMIIIFPLASFLIGIFNNDPRVIFEGARYLRIEFLAFNAYIILNIGLSILQAIRKPHYAIWIGIYRQILMPVLLFNLFGVIFGWGLVGIWWAIVTTTVTGALACLFFVRYELKKLDA
ncbi:MAG: MATE family efflux transporter [Erysipelothrix sp.]|nr:MATE family efflux transporter [Erysipelothrix sp.]